MEAVPQRCSTKRCSEKFPEIRKIRPRVSPKTFFKKELHCKCCAVTFASVFRQLLPRTTFCSFSKQLFYKAPPGNC